MHFSVYIIKLVLLLFCFVMFCGCKTELEEYPVGIAAPGGRTNYAILKEAGFSHLRINNASIENLDAAHALGMKVISPPGLYAKKDFDKELAYKTIKCVDRHPALCAWYLADEPELRKIDPFYVNEFNRYLKLKGVQKPTALVMFKGYEAHNYADIPDILVSDRYPIGWQPIESFAMHFRMIRYAAGESKKVFAMIQAFDWKYYPEVWDGDDPHPPTLDELRNMTWTALALGADGIFYYAYDDKKWKMTEHLETWDALRTVVAEIRAYEPLFKAEHVYCDAKIEYIDINQAYNDVWDPSVILKKVIVKKGNRNIKPGEHILCVNTTKKTIECKILFSKLYSQDIPYFNISNNERGSLEVKNGCGISYLKPYQIIFFETSRF